MRGLRGALPGTDGEVRARVRLGTAGFRAHGQHQEGAAALALLVGVTAVRGESSGQDIGGRRRDAQGGGPELDRPPGRLDEQAAGPVAQHSHAGRPHPRVEQARRLALRQLAAVLRPVARGEAHLVVAGDGDVLGAAGDRLGVLQRKVRPVQVEDVLLAPVDFQGCGFLGDGGGRGQGVGVREAPVHVVERGGLAGDAVVPAAAAAGAPGARRVAGWRCP
ncbi:hypothetical protein [Streptomyces albogriseolus]|uniref:hypothetical protein n=1 Tax=Streptomyces albogriseolus TaxID=1887 RepID=UPI003CF94A60